MGTAMCSIAQIDGSTATVVSNPTKACGLGPCSGACKRLAAAKATLEIEAPAMTEPQFPLAIANEFTAEILKPYRENATYLKAAEIVEVNDKTAIAGTDQKLIIGKGRFSIPESCYIDSTGHFNAVEFNICYNQLAYVLFAGCINAGVMGKVRAVQGEGLRVQLHRGARRRTGRTLVVGVLRRRRLHLVEVHASAQELAPPLDVSRMDRADIGRRQ